jgi:integrase
VAKLRTSRSGRQKGSIDQLPSGALRVRVYAGVDPVTKRRHDLIEVIPPGPKALKQAEAARARLVASVEERRNPRTSATIDQLLDKYLDQFDGAPNTLTNYRGYMRNHVSPLIGNVKVGALDAEVLDSFYAELRRCRQHCSGKAGSQHWTRQPHECDQRCTRPHACRPLGASVVRHIHFLLSGAFERAVRWRWVSVNPVSLATPPAAPKPNPQPPSPREAARIVEEAWKDPDWGALVWTAMTTGARRGELCAIRLHSVDLDEGRETLWLRRAIRKESGVLVEAELKTHQQRRIALDAETAAVLREHIERATARAASLGLDLRADAFLFSGSPDSSTFPIPDSVTQRYDRLAARLGISTTFHRLRHYSATELIAAGVDPRTVAGRLGHGGGGTTTLKTYSAWVSEADQRAATSLGARIPERPRTSSV